MKIKTVIVGAGGTGSYFVGDYVHYTKSDKKNQYSIVVIDGDFVETKNLLRQRFILSDVGRLKVDCLVERYQPVMKANDILTSYPHYIQTAQQVVSLVEDHEDYDEIHIISCVDNNMARLRLHMGASMLHDKWGIRTMVIDGGNSLWTGQTIPYILEANKPSMYKGLYANVTERKPWSEYRYQAYHPQDHVYNVIFVGNSEWQNSLQKGEHELGCDEVVVSNPQNIGTNMMSSMSLLTLLDKNKHKSYRGYNLFDAKTNVLRKQVTMYGVEEDYEAFSTSLYEYLSTDEGYANIFGK